MGPNEARATNLLLRTGEAARLLGTSRQHVVDLCERGDLSFVYVGKHRRVHRSAVESLVRPASAAVLTREQERSLWLHRAAVAHVLTDPTAALAAARSNVENWLLAQRPDGAAAARLREWSDLLDQGVDAVVEAMISPDARACELRQNSPFAGVLPDDVRRRVLQSFNHHWSSEHVPSAAPTS